VLSLASGGKEILSAGLLARSGGPALPAAPLIKQSRCAPNLTGDGRYSRTHQHILSAAVNSTFAPQRWASKSQGA
jgi:hypothetical protein